MEGINIKTLARHVEDYIVECGGAKPSHSRTLERLAQGMGFESYAAYKAVTERKPHEKSLIAMFADGDIRSLTLAGQMYTVYSYSSEVLDALQQSPPEMEGLESEYAVELRWEEDFALWEDALYPADLLGAEKQANGTWRLPGNRTLVIVAVTAAR